MTQRRKPRVVALGAVFIAATMLAAQDEAAAAKSKKRQPAKTDERSDAMLAAHNRARAAVGAPPLRWSKELARYAQTWADRMARDCNLQHRSDGRYGENLGAAASNMGAPDSPPDKVVGNWIAEKQCWKYGTFRKTDQCSASCASRLQSTGCGHYTQVVWSSTKQVGCGRATCSKNGMDWEYSVCNYDPRGNVIGEKPY